MSQMQKELNPELFGDVMYSQQSPKTKVLDTYKLANESLVNEQHYLNLKGQVLSMAETIAKLVSQLDELQRTSHHRLDRMQQNISKLESNDQILAQDTTQKLNQVYNRLGERKSMDLKIQEMVDRHNSVIRTYEVRLNQLQKLLAEKEAQILASQSLMNELKMELSRMKRL